MRALFLNINSKLELFLEYILSVLVQNLDKFFFNKLEFEQRN